MKFAHQCCLQEVTRGAIHHTARGVLYTMHHTARGVPYIQTLMGKIHLMIHEVCFHGENSRFVFSLLRRMVGGSCLLHALRVQRRSQVRNVTQLCFGRFCLVCCRKKLLTACRSGTEALATEEGNSALLWRWGRGCRCSLRRCSGPHGLREIRKGTDERGLHLTTPNSLQML